MSKLAGVLCALSFVVCYASLAGAAPTKSFTAATASLPSGTEVLATSNAKQVRASETFRDVVPALLKMGGGSISNGIGKIKKACGIDPVTAFDDVTLGLDGKSQGAVFIASTLSEKKVDDCLEKIASQEGATLAFKRSGAITEVTSSKSSKPLFYGWLPGDVLVLTSRPGDRALLEQMMGGRGEILRSKLGARIAKMDSSLALSAAVARRTKIESLTVETALFAVSLRGGDVVAEATAEMGSEREAEKVAAGLRMLSVLAPLPKDAPKELQRVIKAIDATSSKNEVMLKVKTSERDLGIIALWGLKQIAN